MLTEAVGVSGRSVLRYRGEPVAHEVRWRGTHIGEADYPGGMVGDCDCGQPVHAARPYTAEQLARVARMHAGIPDP